MPGLSSHHAPYLACGACTAGKIVLDGTDLAKLTESRLTRLRSENIGFVFQSFNLIPTLTAQENVETALVPLGTKVRERRELAAEALRSVGLGERLAEGIRDEIMDVLERLWREHGLTFIMVTHDSALAKKAPRPATLRKGKITVKENAAT
ncbi:ATP-binding cassette domain-containing protein [Streptomyces sp. NPDC046881]|uniref:ATP-binding cassette domain-containing protein n=1 Tax=Streptomyces sp. NPDC046881 TaxID=3155374 RepID=UPI0033E041EB